MPALTRRRDPDVNRETWLIHYDDFRVGSIANATAKSFDAARAAFDIGMAVAAPQVHGG